MADDSVVLANKPSATAEEPTQPLAQRAAHVQLFDVYRNLVLGIEKQYEVKQDKNFEKDPKTLKIYTMPMNKTISIKERKRISLDLKLTSNGKCIETQPFGMK